MPQARLPDINTAYITYRREVLSSLRSRNYTACIGALYALNGLLPEKYRVTISTQEYNEKTNQDLLIKCNKCNQQNSKKLIKIQTVISPLIEGLISGQENIKVWNCILCKAENRLSNSILTQKILKEPTYLQIVPKPPNRKQGMKDHSSYHNQFVVWAETLLIELEAQMAQFRDDNWHKGDEEHMDEYDFAGDEQFDEE